MKQDLSFTIRFPKSYVFFILNGRVSIGLIEKFKVHVKKGNKALRKNPINVRWNTPAYPIEVLYKLSVYKSFTVWVPAIEVFDTKEELIASL